MHIQPYVSSPSDDVTRKHTAQWHYSSANQPLTRSSSKGISTFRLRPDTSGRKDSPVREIGFNNADWLLVTAADA